MTRIATARRRTVRETGAIYRGRPLIVSLEAHELLIREKGRRHAYAVPYLAVYHCGAKLAALEVRTRRQQRRKLPGPR